MEQPFSKPKSSWERKLNHYTRMIPDLKTATIICINQEMYETCFDHVLIEAAWLILGDIGNGGYSTSDWVKEIGKRMNAGMSYEDAVSDLP